MTAFPEKKERKYASQQKERVEGGQRPSSDRKKQRGGDVCLLSGGELF